MGDSKRKLLFLVIVVLFVGIAFVDHSLDPMATRIRKYTNNSNNGGELMVQLPGQFMVASVAGFKEVLAGALWVKADDFFHTGQFPAIIPIVRLVTWLDPHNLDVYSTGAWHLDYNFVSDGQMSDKRYIPPAVALLKEGIRNNPKIWDLYFELGWTHYNKKLQDYDKSLEYIEKACKLNSYDVNTGKQIPRPEYVDRMLAHQYEKVGRFDDAIKQWGVARKRIVDANKGQPKNLIDTGSLDVCDRNLAMLYLRLAYRYGDMDAYKKGVDIYKRFAARKGCPADIVESAPGVAADYARRVATNTPPRDALKPLDVGFDVTCTKAAPRVLLLKGTLKLAPESEYKGLASEVLTHWYGQNAKASANVRQMWRDGCRVRWKLTDYDYKMTEMSEFNWKIDTTRTVIWDSVYVGGGSFSERLDFSKKVDREFFPFSSKKYKLTVWFVPQEPDAPDYIQDRIGWKGEAITDKRYLDTESMPGFHLVKKEFVLDKKDIL